MGADFSLLALIQLTGAPAERIDHAVYRRHGVADGYLSAVGQRGLELPELMADSGGAPSRTHIIGGRAGCPASPGCRRQPYQLCCLRCICGSQFLRKILMPTIYTDACCNFSIRPILSARRLLLTALACTACAPSIPAAPPSALRDFGIARPITPVVDASAPPYRSVCHLLVHRPRGGPYNSTGALIARRQLLTAAHNVHSPFFNRIRNSELRCGRSADAAEWAPQQKFGARDQNTAHGYTWRRFGRDYARVHLPVAAPYAADFRLLRPEETPPSVGDTVHVAGFPWTDDVVQGKMYETEGEVVEVTPQFLYYDADTRGGMSGGPIWIERGGEFIIVGVHVAGTDSMPSAPARATARKIDPEAFAAIRHWMAADTAR